MKIARIVFRYLNFWIAQSVLFFALLCIHNTANSAEKIVVKDYSWVRKIQYKNSLIFISKFGRTKRIGFVKGNRRTFYQKLSNGQLRFDFEESSTKFDHRIFLKKGKDGFQVGYLGKKTTKYNDIGACHSAMTNIVTKYQTRDFEAISQYTAKIKKIWKESNCADVIGDPDTATKVFSSIAAVVEKNRNATTACFGESDITEKFLNDQSATDLAFRFITGFESTISLIDSGNEPFKFSCISGSNAPLASLDKKVSPNLFILNVNRLKKAGADVVEETKAIDELGWSAFHEMGHKSIDLPGLISWEENCFDELAVGKITEFCSSGKETKLSLNDVVKSCRPINAQIQKNSNKVEELKNDDKVGEVFGKTPSAAVALAESAENVKDSAPTATRVAANTNPAVYAPVSSGAFDTIVNDTLASTSGNPLQQNQERAVVPTPQFAGAVEEVYSQMNHMTTSTAEVLARSLLPEAQATTDSGTAYSVGAGKSATGTSTNVVAVSKPNYKNPVYKPAEYVTDLTCPTENCAVSPQLEQSYNSVLPGASTQTTLAAANGIDGSRGGGIAANPSGAQGKMDGGAQPGNPSEKLATQAQQTVPAIEGGSVPATTTGSASSAPANSGGGTSPARGIASTGAATNTTNGGDSKALQILAAGDQIKNQQYLTQIRQQYGTKAFDDQLAARGWSISVEKNGRVIQTYGKESGATSVFIDSGSAITRKAGGR